MRIAFLGNFIPQHSSEAHHAWALENLGHTVVRLQERDITGRELHEQAHLADMFVWVHSHGWPVISDRQGWPGSPISLKGLLYELRQKKIPTVAYHLDLYMGIPSRWAMYQNSDYITGGLQHFFTVDSLMADWLNENTSTKGHWLPPGVHEPECYMANPQYSFDVAFVGSRHYHPEWPERPKLIQWLEDSFGPRFRGCGADFGASVRGRELNQLYADARVVVGDSFCPGYTYQGHYWSDRATETLGRGGFLLHPRVPFMDETFEDKKHLVYYDFGDMSHLNELIHHYLQNTGEREQIRKQGHEYVKANHTYTNRWRTIIETVT